MMKTVFVKAPFQFKIKEIPIPQPAAGEVLLRVKACGICGSDVSYYFGKSPLETICTSRVHRRRIG